MNIPTPIDMVLHCPVCRLPHVDAPKDCDMGMDCDKHGVCYAEAQGEPSRCSRWTNPPHKSHLCHGCGFIWRPADVPTNGVDSTMTQGKEDSLKSALGVDWRSDWILARSTFKKYMTESDVTAEEWRPYYHGWKDSKKHG